LKRQFLSGVLIVVPLILTYVVLKFLFDSLDGIFSPMLYKALGYNIPGLGIFLTILVILLTGFFTRSLVGASIYKKGDKVLAKTPLIRVIYLAAKQLINAITMPQIKTFKEVVMIEYMRKGLFAIGFATSEVKCVNIPTGSEKMVGVFIPSTPTPISGVLVFVAKSDITPLNMTVEDAMTLLVSGGVVAPVNLVGMDASKGINLERENASGKHT